MTNLFYNVKSFNDKLNLWASSHFIGVSIFNLVLIILFLLYSAGYFKPFLPISINLIVFIALIMSIFLLGAKNRAFFIISLLFWLFAAFLRILDVTVWAERTTVYMYQSLIIGVVLLIVENIAILKSSSKA